VELIWHDRAFAELAAAELYAIVALRERVFVVEQTCAYLDADGLDPVSRHLWAERPGPGRTIAAYLRLVPPGARFAELSIGRVVVAPEARGTGLGRALMRRGIAAAGGVAIRLAAQAHLQRFYGELGFARASDAYDEDGIPHVDMLRPAGS
jgi:ElaA protein